jgi:16S rRNA (uracil1498-N3)-methyltransferase
VSATTLVVPPEALAGDEHRIGGESYHHLFRVKRLAVGDALRLVDGAGRARGAEIVSISKREAVARLGAEVAANEASLAVELFVAPPKPERAAWLVEKATELGVAAIRFLPAARGARELAAAQLERLRRIAVAAVEQAGRARVPEIAAAPELDALLVELQASRTPGLALDAGGSISFSGPFSLALSTRCRLAVFVGPEGGWTEEERALLARAGVERWSLGVRTLRVETAAVVAAGILLAAGAPPADARVDTPRGGV